MRIAIRVAASLLFCAGLPLMADDLTITSKVTHDGGPPQTAVSYMSSDHVRMASGDGDDIIVDMKTGEMTNIDNKKRTYYVMTKADMASFAEKMKEKMNSPEIRKGQEQMKNMPPEQKKQMEAMFGAMMTVDVRKSGGSRTIAGYSCDNWTVNIGQFSKSQQCLTNELKYPAQTYEMFKDFADSMKTMMASMGPMADSAAKMREELKKMKGIPLANTTTVDVMGHKTVTTSEVTSVTHGAIPSSAWQIPAGYAKVDNPMLKAFDRHSR